MAPGITEISPAVPSIVKSMEARRVSEALKLAHAAFLKRNTKSYKVYQKALSHLPGANTRTTIHRAPFPLTFDNGESAFLTGIDGDKYIDFLGDFTVGIYGHSCQPIKEAIQNALDGGWNYGGSSIYEKKLAAMLVERFSNSVEMIRFCNSGTEANLMALGAAINFTGRKKVLVFSNAYHGSVFYFKNPMPSMSMNAPYDFAIAPYNDITGTASILSALPANSLAAILVEPMQGSGGCISSTPEFLQFLRRSADSLDALLIFDEVMTSRLAYGGYQSRPEICIKPDLTTLGKWIGGGMSFGAFGGRKEIMQMFDPRSGKLAHSGTFNNNVFSMAAGLAGCAILTSDKLDQLNARGDRLRKAINKLIDNHWATSKNRMSVKGIGSLMTIAFTGPGGDDLLGLFYHHMLASGIDIAGRGMIALSIEITDNHCESFLIGVESFLLNLK